jgi:hypothetical protein
MPVVSALLLLSVVVDISLKVGDTSAQVTVTGDAPLVETTDSTVGALINSSQMRDVPLNGRELQQLILLAPGVNQVNADGSAGGVADVLVVPEHLRNRDHRHTKVTRDIFHRSRHNFLCHSCFKGCDNFIATFIKFSD